jgi:hypothetical protein
MQPVTFAPGYRPPAFPGDLISRYTAEHDGPGAADGRADRWVEFGFSWWTYAALVLASTLGLLVLALRVRYNLALLLPMGLLCGTWWGSFSGLCDYARRGAATVRPQDET